MSEKNEAPASATGSGSPEIKPVEPKRPRAQSGDFERQVEQIRKDLKAVRENLDAAEKALGNTEALNAASAIKVNPPASSSNAPRGDTE